MSGWLRHGVVLILLLIAIWRMLLPALRESNFGIHFDPEGGIAIHDFAGNLAFAKAFWTSGTSYDVASHLRLTAAWAGRPVHIAMPFNYSPTMLWVLLPFSLLPMAWSYVLWTLVSLVAAWWISQPQCSMWTAVALLSPVSVVCLVLGQTSFLTTAALLYLMLRHLEAQRAESSDSRTSYWVEGVLLWALTAKPPVAVTVAVVLLTLRRWRSLVLACGLTVLSTVVLTPRLGAGWTASYFHLMAHSNVETGDPALAWSLGPETMGNLRALLYATFHLGDASASRLSSVAWVLALCALVLGAMRQRWRSELIWGLAVLSYLLFCPHVSSTGELHLVLLFVLFARAAPPVARSVHWAVILLVLLILFLHPAAGLYHGLLRLPIVVGGKLLLVGMVWAQWAVARQE